MYSKQARRASGTDQAHSFGHIPPPGMQRSVFNRGSSMKTTFSSGELVPIFVDEALPGDTISMNLSSFARMATPLYPVMDNQWMDFFWFAVPLRLLWDNFQRFMGEQDDPDDSIDFLIPIMTGPGAPGYLPESLQDHMGIPSGIDDVEHSALFTRAYALIWNQWFRDQNLQDSIPFSKGDGPDDPADYVLQRRGKRKDYFTGALPFPQKGDPVSIPFADSAPVIQITDGAPTLEPILGTGGSAGLMEAHTGNDMQFPNHSDTNSGLKWVDPQLQADLSSAINPTINSLRTAFQIQKLFERDARGGTRYTELLRAHFGVTSPDARLQRPEFLGGGSHQVSIAPVPNTSGQLGTLGAFAVTGGSQVGFTKSFTEHCIVMGLVATRADLHYQQGLNRMFSRRTKYDFYWPALAHLGEQAILLKEIFIQDPASMENDDVFAYQERWAEYRYKPSETSGKMRSTAPLPLDAWHLAQHFATAPVLGADFIEENPPLDRVLAVSGETQWLLDCSFAMKHARPMPTYSVPGNIDRF